MPGTPGSWEKRVNRGLCGECGQRQLVPNRKRCQKCLDRKAKYKRKKANRADHAAHTREMNALAKVKVREPSLTNERAHVERMLTEVKVRLDDIKPFYDRAVDSLASSYEDLMDAEIASALHDVDPVERRRSRQFLLNMFPKLIPPESRKTDDPLAAVAEAIQRKGGKIAVMAEVGSFEPDGSDGEGEALTVDISRTGRTDAIPELIGS
jgi:hypothetical protein